MSVARDMGYGIYTFTLHGICLVESNYETKDLDPRVIAETQAPFRFGEIAFPPGRSCFPILTYLVAFANECRALVHSTCIITIQENGIKKRYMVA